MLNRWVGSRIPETKETNIPYTKRRKKRLWNGFQSRQHIEKVPAPQCASNRKLRFTAIFIKTRDMCVGFYTNRLRTVPAGRGSGRKFDRKCGFDREAVWKTMHFDSLRTGNFASGAFVCLLKFRGARPPEFWKTAVLLRAAAVFHLMRACGAGCRI